VVENLRRLAETQMMMKKIRKTMNSGRVLKLLLLGKHQMFTGTTLPDLKEPRAH
jgi:hypothetical protein